MIVRRDFVKRIGINRYVCRGYYLFGVIPLYVKMYNPDLQVYPL